MLSYEDKGLLALYLQVPLTQKQTCMFYTSYFLYYLILVVNLYSYYVSSRVQLPYQHRLLVLSFYYLLQKLTLTRFARLFVVLNETLFPLEVLKLTFTLFGTLFVAQNETLFTILYLPPNPFQILLYFLVLLHFKTSQCP